MNEHQQAVDTLFSKLNSLIVNHLAKHRKGEPGLCYVDGVIFQRKLAGEIEHVDKLLSQVEAQSSSLLELKAVIEGKERLPAFEKIYENCCALPMGEEGILDPNVLLDGVDWQQVPAVVDCLRIASAEQLFDQAKKIGAKRALSHLEVRRLFAYLAKREHIVNEEIIRVYDAEGYATTLDRHLMVNKINRDVRDFKNSDLMQELYR